MSHPDPRIGFLLDGKRANMPLTEFARMIKEAMPQTDEERYFADLDAAPRQLEMNLPDASDLTRDLPGDLKAQRMAEVFRILRANHRPGANIATGKFLYRQLTALGVKFWEREPTQALTDCLTGLIKAGCLERPVPQGRCVRVLDVDNATAIQRIREFRVADKLRQGSQSH